MSINENWSATLTDEDYPNTQSAASILLRLARSPFGINALANATVKGDGITDDGPALQYLLDNNLSNRLLLPRTARVAGAPSYFSSIPLTISSPGQSIIGAGGGLFDGTIIKFAKGIVGINILPTATRAEVRDLVLLGQSPWAQANLATCVLPKGFTTFRTPVDNIIRSSNTCTLLWTDLTEGFSLSVGQRITVKYADDISFDGTFVITGVTGTSITYHQNGSNTTTRHGFIGAANWYLTDAIAPDDDGVRVGANLCRLTNVSCRDWGRHGFNLSNEECNGYSDDCTLIDCYSYTCRGYGIYISGADSNASVFIHFQASVCGLGAVFDNSFLGNGWYSPKVDECHFDAWGYGILVNDPPTNANPTEFSIASINRTDDIVTLTFAEEFNPTTGFEAGLLVPANCIKVTVPNDSTFNGTFCLISVDGATVTYAQGGSNVTPSVTNATASRALQVFAWDQAGIPRSAGAYRTPGSGAHRSTFYQAYSEGGMAPLGSGPTSRIGIGCKIEGGNLSPDFEFSIPMIFGLVGGIGQQGFTGAFPSVITPSDHPTVFYERCGTNADQDSIRIRQSADGARYWWYEMEGATNKCLYTNSPAALPAAISVYNIDHESGRTEFGVPVVFPNFATTNRPTTGLVAGSTGYDTTLHKLITWDGIHWRDQGGNLVS